MKALICFFVLSLILIKSGYSIEVQNDPVMTKIDSGLIQLMQIQKKISHIHPFLEKFQPIAIHNQDKLYIYDYDTFKSQYVFIKKSPPPYPMIDGIRASFPLSVYNWKPTCVVSLDIFNSLDQLVLIFHEFVHCTQANTVEFKIKDSLAIHQQAMKNSDYMWEINHAFPYSDTLFIKYYDEFLDAVKDNDEIGILESRQFLKNHLNKIDYEYMTWQEWKEGLARYIENGIKRELGLEENFYGKEKPYHRVTFYYGGELFIDYLFKRDKILTTNLEALFNGIYNDSL